MVSTTRVHSRSCLLHNASHRSHDRWIRCLVDAGRGRLTRRVLFPFPANGTIRPGWFYHSHEDGAVRSIQNLIELWFASVRRNSHLLLNIPPTPAGRFHETDVATLRALGEFRRQLVATGLAADGKVVRRDDKTWELQLPEVREFDIVSIAEPIELGQRVAAYRIYILDEHDQWQWLTEAHTIGCRKLDRSTLVRAKALRIEVTRSRAGPLLSEIALHRCPHPSSLQ